MTDNLRERVEALATEYETTCDPSPDADQPDYALQGVAKRLRALLVPREEEPDAVEILEAKADYVRSRCKELAEWMADEVMPRIRAFANRPVEVKDGGGQFNLLATKLDSLSIHLRDIGAPGESEDLRKLADRVRFTRPAAADALLLDAYLSGTDGNVFALVARVRRVLLGASLKVEAEEMAKKVLASGSYDEALQIMMQYVDAR